MCEKYLYHIKIINNDYNISITLNRENNIFFYKYLINAYGILCERKKNKFKKKKAKISDHRGTVEGKLFIQSIKFS